MLTDTFSPTTRDAVLSLLGIVTIGAGFLGLLIRSTVFHALHRRDADLVDPHQVSFAETPRFTALAARGFVVWTVLEASPSAVQILFINRTVHLTAIGFRHTTCTDSNKPCVAEAACGALF